jgi:hypothetical protein
VIGGKGELEAAGRKELDRHLTTSDHNWSWEKELQKIYDGLDAKSRESFGVSERVLICGPSSSFFFVCA